MSKEIRKIGGIITQDRKILVVRKYVEGRTEYIIPGGRVEGNETHEETLSRELREELDIDLKSMDYFGTFREMAIFENVPLVMDVYRVQFEGEPRANSEIKEIVWLDRYYEKEGYKLGSVLSQHVIPGLIKQEVI